MYDYEGHVFVSEEPNGVKKHYLGAILHREAGPAIEYPDGSGEWFLNGKRHRIDGPAVDGVNGTFEWWENGEKIQPELRMEKVIPPSFSWGSSSVLSDTQPTLKEKPVISSTLKKDDERNYRKKAREKSGIVDIGPMPAGFKEHASEAPNTAHTSVEERVQYLENIISDLRRQMEDITKKFNDLISERKIDKPRFPRPTKK